MVHRSLYLLLLTCMSSAGGQGGLPAPPQAAAAAPFRLSEVLDIAHQRNPSLLAGQQHLSAVRSQEISAGLRQNPSAIVGAQTVTLKPNDPNGTEIYQFGLQRLFERGNKRQARTEVARLTSGLAGLQLDDQRRQLDSAIRQAFARMLFAQEALAITQENLDSYRKTVALMRIRLEAGAIDKTDFDRVELQLASFENDTDNAALTLRQGSITLQNLMGLPVPTAAFAIRGELEPPPVTVTVEELSANALANRPDLKAAAAQVQVNVSTLKLAIANGTADPVVEAEYERAGDANTFGGNINLPLRIFDRNQGEQQRARFELESSRLALTASQNQVRTDVDSGWAAYLAAQTQATRYRSKYVQEAAHVRDNLEFSYRNGNTTLLDYLSALADYRQVNLAALNADLQLLLSLDQLSYLTQMELVP